MIQFKGEKMNKQKKLLERDIHFPYRLCEDLPDVEKYEDLLWEGLLKELNTITNDPEEEEEKEFHFGPKPDDPKEKE